MQKHSRAAWRWRIPRQCRAWFAVLVLGLAGMGQGARAAETTPVPAAGNTAAPAAAAPKRELLKPPTMAIASPITDRFALTGTFMRPSIDTRVRYDGSPVLPGTLFTAEDVLGMKDKLDQGGIEMMVRMNDRHRLRMDFNKTHRTGDDFLDQVVRFGDDTYRVNDRVVSDLDMRTFSLVYTYSFLRKEKFELGMGLGVHLLQVFGKAAVPARLLEQKFDVAGPYPTLALDGTWRFTKRFSLNVRGEYLAGSTNTVDGLVMNYHGDVQFRFRPNLAFGVGYTHQRMKIDSTDSDFSGLFDMRTSGPEAFVRVSF